MPVQPTYPGVYVTEIDAFPAQIVAMPTDQAGFVGYAETGATDEAVMISSMVDYVARLGGPPVVRFRLTAKDGALRVKPVRKSQFFLYHAVRQFFENGGQRCWVAAVGDYGTSAAPTIKTHKALRRGLRQLAAVKTVGIIAVPDAVLLGRSGYARVARATLNHCARRRGRFAIVDVHNGHRAQSGDPDRDVIDGAVTGFRTLVTAEDLSFGATYYPWVYLPHAPVDDMPPPTFVAAHLPAIQAIFQNEAGGTQLPTAISDAIGQLTSSDTAARQAGHRTLLGHSQLYATAMTQMAKTTMLIPPSGTVAGVMARTDTTRGVWKAPAGVAVSGITELAVLLDDAGQSQLNPPNTAKQVNAIRHIEGQGLVVWGARTLAGNDNEWRYVSVRRFAAMLEASIHNGLDAFVFEPNDANTWSQVAAMIRSFLQTFFAQGALAGSRADDAYFVRVGLGETMTQNDLDNGRLICEIGVAMLRPAEFVVLRVTRSMAET